jgi:hypothetical protein
MFTKTQNKNISLLLSIIWVGLLWLSSCTIATSTTTLPNPSATSAPLATLEPANTLAPTIMAVPTSDGSLNFSLDTSGLAVGFQTETIAAVSSSGNAPYWEVLPEYILVTLQDYPISSHLMKPQIFIYPVKELGEVNEGAGKIVASLQLLLQSPQEIETMPFLPLFNSKQMIHAHLQYLDFKNGQGLRYLTWFSQGIVPVNNDELIYTYQGLTSDGKYYVAAVLPVNHPSLPADGTVTRNEPSEFTSDYPTYLANVVKSLNPQSASTFTPDLTQLDAMMSSLEINTPTTLAATSVPATEAPTVQTTSITGVAVSYAPLSLVLPLGVASGVSGSQLPRVDGAEAAWWQLTPGHTQLQLEGYLLQGKSRQPILYVFPAQGYAELYPGAFESIRRLDNIHGDPGAPISPDQLPTVPFLNEKQVFASNILAISFQNGWGVRFLTEYAQYAASANNQDLFYHFQGMTNDGAYYILAILPISVPVLAETSDGGAVLPPGGVPYSYFADPNANMQTYYTAVTELLNATSPESFTPTINRLDLLIQSIQITP